MNVEVPTKPSWLKAKLPQGEVFAETKQIVDDHSLHTVCQSAQCPNIGECWALKTATFMILGNICTRNCSFCAVNKGRPLDIDLDEPEKVARSIFKMQLKHAVITSVTRDDLPDEGASIWAETIRTVRKLNPKTSIEVLVPDFNGNESLLDIVLEAKPDIFNHNLETVGRLQLPIRKTARYERSLGVLEYAYRKNFVTKSGLMLGLGESMEEIHQTLHDLRTVNCKMLTLGQYLQPSKQNISVARWISPSEFEELKKKALSLGFSSVQAGPFVRSSYKARTI